MFTKALFTDIDNVVFNSELRAQKARDLVDDIVRTLRDKMALNELKNVSDSIFYSGAGLYNAEWLIYDQPVTFALDTIMRLFRNGWTVFYHSSRPNYLREGTIAQLRAHGFPCATQLLLNPPGARDNYQRTAVLKHIWLESFINTF